MEYFFKYRVQLTQQLLSQLSNFIHEIRPDNDDLLQDKIWLYIAPSYANFRRREHEYVIAGVVHHSTNELTVNFQKRITLSDFSMYHKGEALSLEEATFISHLIHNHIKRNEETRELQRINRPLHSGTSENNPALHFALLQGKKNKTLRDELEHLDFPYFQDIYLDEDNTLHVETDEVYLEDTPKTVGPFHFTLDFRYQTVRELHRKRHPHVDSDGIPCFGNIDAEIVDYMRQVQIPEVLDLLHRWLPSYNPDDCHFTMHHGMCDVCGDTIWDEDEYTRCTYCEEMSCTGCGNVYLTTLIEQDGSIYEEDICEYCTENRFGFCEKHDGYYDNYENECPKCVYEEERREELRNEYMDYIRAFALEHSESMYIPREAA